MYFKEFGTGVFYGIRKLVKFFTFKIFHLSTVAEIEIEQVNHSQSDFVLKIHWLSPGSQPSGPKFHPV